MYLSLGRNPTVLALLLGRLGKTMKVDDIVLRSVEWGEG